MRADIDELRRLRWARAGGRGREQFWRSICHCTLVGWGYDCFTQHCAHPHRRPDAALGFYRDTLGLTMSDEVAYQGFRDVAVRDPAGNMLSIEQG